MVSSGQLAQLRMTLSRMMQMTFSGTGMIEQLREEIKKELAEEKQAAAQYVRRTAVRRRYPNMQVEEDYLGKLDEQMRQYLQFLRRLGSELSLCEKQMSLVDTTCSSLQQKRVGLQTTGQSVSTAEQPGLKELRERLSSAWEALMQVKSQVVKLVHRVEKLSTDEIQVRLVVQNADRLGGADKVRAILLEQVQYNKQEVERGLKEMSCQFESVCSLCGQWDEMEKAMEKNQEYTQRREVMEDIDSINQIYTSCENVGNSNLKELESIASSLTMMQKNFFEFHRRMEEVRKVREREYSSRSISPANSGSMEVVGEKHSVHVKGWACSVCGIVNDNSKLICDGCLQRHI